ncbi:signal peptide peptidase SppA [Arsenicitalea aurantiaca]|uniref:Signal peptide peptidase SppA n=1 Tax=Arsenicitalea aurantiaca TaxID=1783274 RepID=A0A433X8B2_9HYPH|nr:signal peptide peptidase SppA [Arsenicitalea aurantiaca]RUT30306.1 signal peptide peptidase SppA [Arsenicitalea aurantiaca]
MTTETETSPEIARPADPHAIPVASRLRRSRRLWRTLFFVALLVAVVALAGRFALEGSAGGGTERIARIEVDGTIVTDPDRLRAMERLAEDPNVAAVIVAINSPGGSTAGGEELYEALRRLGADKPVVSVVKEMGASAAYMTAIATEQIFARRLSIVGSIGVLYQHVNAAGLLDTIGIDLDKVASGPLKAEPDFSGPMSPEARASIAALVNDSFQWFVDAVAEERGMTRLEALGLSDGRIVSGRMALESGLIDQIGGEAEAIAWLAETHDIDPELPVRTAYPEPDEGFGGLMRLLRGEARSILGLPARGPIMLDGLVSLWQVEPSL